MSIKTTLQDDVYPSNKGIEHVNDDPIDEISYSGDGINPLQNLSKNTFLTAGFKVRDKLQDLEMLVIGFTDTDRIITTDHKLNSIWSVYQKIYCNVSNKSDYELFNGKIDNKYYYYFFTNILDTWQHRGEGADDFYFICKYWDKEKNDYFYMTKRFFEVEKI